MIHSPNNVTVVASIFVVSLPCPQTNYVLLVVHLNRSCLPCVVPALGGFLPLVTTGLLNFYSAPQKSDGLIQSILVCADFFISNLDFSDMGRELTMDLQFLKLFVLNYRIV